MREIISSLMLTVDETWLNHAARINASGTVRPEDVWLEDVLFALEALLDEASRDLVPKTRPRTGAGQPTRLPGARWKFLGSQPR